MYCKWFLPVIFFVIVIECSSTHITQFINRSRRASLPPGALAKRKCEEYSQYKTRIGVRNIIGVGGEDVSNLSQFPHMALLGYDLQNETTWACGGTIISEKFILTAAHCTSIGPNQVSRVQVGFLDKRNKTIFGTLQEFKVIEKFVHEDRKPPQSYNDIALLELERPVRFSGVTYPACLYLEHNITLSVASAAGWGKLGYYDESTADILQEVKLIIRKKEECDPIYSSQMRKLPHGIDDATQLCAGQRDVDTCQGDSGGPLQIRYRGMANIIGITSFGTNCGLVPSIYTRVSHYVPWIESIVWT